MDQTNTDVVEDVYSWNTFDGVFTAFVEGLKPKTVLDIGAGSGKYGKLIRKTIEGSHITAIEIDADGAARNNLNSTYDHVVTELPLDFLMRSPKETFDLVVIGDCIEHMLKSVGLDLLNFLNYRSAYIFIITPDGMVMNTEPYFLGHISNWTERDFLWHDNFAFERVGVMQLFMMRGLLRPDKPSLAQFADHFKALQLPLHLENGQFVREIDLKLVNQMVTWEAEPGSSWSHRPF